MREIRTYGLAIREHYEIGVTPPHPKGGTWFDGQFYRLLTNDRDSVESLREIQKRIHGSVIVMCVMTRTSTACTIIITDILDEPIPEYFFL